MRKGQMISATWKRGGKEYVVTGRYQMTDPKNGIWLSQAVIDNGSVARRVASYRIPATVRATVSEGE